MGKWSEPPVGVEPIAESPVERDSRGPIDMGIEPIVVEIVGTD